MGQQVVQVIRGRVGENESCRGFRTAAPDAPEYSVDMAPWERAGLHSVEITIATAMLDLALAVCPEKRGHPDDPFSEAM